MTLEIPVLGREDQYWKAVLSALRHLRVSCGKGIKLFVQDYELIDDKSDDLGESWHTLDWRKEKVADEGRGEMR